MAMVKIRKQNMWGSWLMVLTLTLGSPGTLAKDEERPAPWSLEGDGYIVLSAVPKEANLDAAFIPESMKSRYRQSFGVVMLVNYKTSPVGPYRELLYIPGTFAFEDGKTHASISKIFVSSMESVVNGRKNWGIPKEMADFSVDQNGDGTETIMVSTPSETIAVSSPSETIAVSSPSETIAVSSPSETIAVSSPSETIAVPGPSEIIARFTFSPRGPQFPLTTHLVPRFLRTLGQSLNGQTSIFTPAAHGWAQRAVLVEASSHPDFFPEPSLGKTLLAFKINRFKMEFPKAQVFPSDSQPEEARASTTPGTPF